MAKKNTGLILAVIAFFVFCICVAAGAGGWYYFNKNASSSSAGGGAGGGGSGGAGGGTPRTPGGAGGGTPRTPGGAGGAPGCTPAGSASKDSLGGDCCWQPTDGSNNLDVSGICLSAPALGPAPGPAPGSASGGAQGPPPPTDCVGYWGGCSAQCNDGTNTAVQHYIVTTPASNGGQACKDTDGTVRTAADTKPCYSSLPLCGVNCVGDWIKNANTDSDGFGPCSSSCGSGTQTRTYHITTQQQAGGAACPHQEGETETRPCPNLPTCPQNTNCVGDWGDGWSGCSKGCGGGTKTRTYYIRTPKSGSGQDCPYTNGHVESEPCNTTPCCDLATTDDNDWFDTGAVFCTGTSDPNPWIFQNRPLYFPAADGGKIQQPLGTACPPRSSLVLQRKRYTAGPDPNGNKCDPRVPTGGTCSLGNSWSATNGCAITPASVASTPNAPVKGTAISCGNNIHTNSSGQCGLTLSAKFGGGFLPSPPTDWSCPSGYQKNTTYNWFANPLGLTQSQWDGYGMCSPIPGNSSTNACPANYDLQSDNTCKARTSTITGLTCDSTYFSQNLNTNKCEAN